MTKKYSKHCQKYLKIAKNLSKGKKRKSVDDWVKIAEADAMANLYGELEEIVEDKIMRNENQHLGEFYGNT